MDELEFVALDDDIWGDPDAAWDDYDDEDEYRNEDGEYADYE